jgi:hypothetical protein
METEEWSNMFEKPFDQSTTGVFYDRDKLKADQAGPIHSFTCTV